MESAETSSALDESMLNCLRGVLCRVEARLCNCPIDWDTSLIDELMLDSMHFVDLVAALEALFELNEFPFQQWYDEEAHKEPRRYTLRSLATLAIRVRNAK